MDYISQRADLRLTLYLGLIPLCLLLVLLLGAYIFQNVQDRLNEPKGCSRHGRQARSNLADEHNEYYASPKGHGGNGAWRVKSLWIYPIKSCRGVELDEHTITGSGMQYDRRFSFAQLISKVDGGKTTHRWKFITQRNWSPMALIKTEIWLPDPTSKTYSKDHFNVQNGGVLVIKCPTKAKGSALQIAAHDMLTSLGMTPYTTIHLPFNPGPEQIGKSGYTTENMDIWKDSPNSLIMANTENGDAWIQDLGSYLKISNQLALFRVSSDVSREVYRCAPRKETLGYQPTVGFQDAYPLHILNLASVHDVANHMVKGAPRIGGRNFRPNIVITGGDAYAEDSWKRIKIGKFEYDVSSRTVRCLLPNVNPATGVKHTSEPNRTLKEIRRIDQGDPLNACLGMQMVPMAEFSKIKVGEEVTVLEEGEHFYIRQ